MDYIRMGSAANANLQNTINTSIILHYVRDKGAAYRSEISKSLKLSLPAVSRAVQQLVERKVFVEKRIITESGKKAHEVGINASLGVVIGISIELPVIRFSRMDMAGKILDLFETSISSNIENLNEFIMKAFGTFITRTYVDEGDNLPLLAVCLSVPMAVDAVNNRIHAVLFKSLDAKELQNWLQTEQSVPVIMENAENLAAHAEKFYEEGIPEKTFAFITVHQGTGAGLFIDGRIFCGANGAAGEIGYQHLVKNSRESRTLEDTYENLASIDKIRKIAVELIHSGKGEEILRAANFDYDAIDHTLVAGLAKEGSKDALEIFERYAGVLAIGLANLLVIINPETLILGGALLDLGDGDCLIVEPLIRALEPLIPFPVPRIRMTRLGREAAVIGAAQFALESTIFRDYPYILN